MCRLALFNRQAAELLANWQALEYIFGRLETSFGGHGNGIGALWSDGRVKMQKGLSLTTSKAAQGIERYVQQEADWMLFHTRRASSSAIADRHCHPFHYGQIVLAHNGHDQTFARLGRATHVTDTECITRAWARIHFPLSELAELSGVFIGFHHAAPFVIKGTPHSDLIAAWHRASGAILFASEIPSFLARGVFDEVVDINRIAWFGRELDASTLDARPYEEPYQISRNYYAREYYGSYLWHPETAEQAELAEEEFWMDDEALREMEEAEELDEEDFARVQTVRKRDWRQGKQVDEPEGYWWK